VSTFARILEDLGPDRVEKVIGTNQTGLPFNSVMAIELNEKHRAGNPFVNAGAITAVSLVPANSAGDRWTRILATMNVLAGRTLTVDDEVYRSESATNTRNRGISWLLKSYKDVVTGDPGVALDLYTRQCSVSVTAHDLAVMGATLANGGTNPVTGQRVLSPANAARVLSEMLTTGLYENSGSWSFHVGVPAKSGVGGGIVAVVPGRFAIGTFSPPIDEAGNSVRGMRAIESIAKDLSANIFAANRQSSPSQQPVGLAGTSH
jgi:glutaminase